MSELVDLKGFKVFSKEKFEELDSTALGAISPGTFIFVEDDGSEIENLKDYLEGLILVLKNSVQDLESMLDDASAYGPLVSKLSGEGFIV